MIDRIANLKNETKKQGITHHSHTTTSPKIKRNVQIMFNSHTLHCCFKILENDQTNQPQFTIQCDVLCISFTNQYKTTKFHSLHYIPLHSKLPLHCCVTQNLKCDKTLLFTSQTNSLNFIVMCNGRNDKSTKRQTNTLLNTHLHKPSKHTTLTKSKSNKLNLHFTTHIHKHIKLDHCIVCTLLTEKETKNQI